MLPFGVYKVRNALRNDYETLVWYAVIRAKTSGVRRLILTK